LVKRGESWPRIEDERAPRQRSAAPGSRAG
jgi:hypothetical protein